jgi:hypothetical protein
MSSRSNCPSYGNSQGLNQRFSPASSQSSNRRPNNPQLELKHSSKVDIQSSVTDRTSYLTTTEAAEYIRVSKQFLEIARHRGDGPPYIKLARAVRYHRPSLDQWMLARQRNHTAEREV